MLRSESTLRVRRAAVAALLALALPLMANDCSGSSSSGSRRGGSDGGGSFAASSGGGGFASAGGSELTPGPGPATPEPGAFALFAVGAALAAGSLRRVRRR